MIEQQRQQEPQQNKRLRTLPQNELDMNLMLINTFWGQDEVNPDLKERLNELNIVVDKDGKTKQDITSLWGVLSYFNRDMRLSNLDERELAYCHDRVNLAGDMLNVGFPKMFILLISRANVVTEYAQSKRGFLRKILNTFFQNVRTSEGSPVKKSMFGGMKK